MMEHNVVWVGSWERKSRRRCEGGEYKQNILYGFKKIKILKEQN